MIKLIGPVIVSEFERDNHRYTITFKRESGEALTVIKEHLEFPEELMIYVGNLAKIEYNDIMQSSLFERLTGEK